MGRTPRAAGAKAAGPPKPAKGFDVLQQQTFVQLQTLPNVGPATARDFLRLGVASVDDLSRRDPKELYARISAMDGVRHDPCVLDTYAAAIHAARTGEAVPWYRFSDLRKAAQVSADRPRLRTY